MHFVDTMHFEAHTFTYICTHSDAFDTVRILMHSYAYGNRIQPRDDTVEEEGDGEESDEDLDGM